jgi:hypothetical protein
MTHACVCIGVAARVACVGMCVLQDIGMDVVLSSDATAAEEGKAANGKGKRVKTSHKSLKKESGSDRPKPVQGMCVQITPETNVVRDHCCSDRKADHLPLNLFFACDAMLDSRCSKYVISRRTCAHSGEHPHGRTRHATAFNNDRG